MLELLAARKPLLLVLDDLQWAEPALFDLLDELAEEVVGRCSWSFADAPSSRTCALRFSLGASVPCPWRKLVGLSPSESETLVRTVLGVGDLAAVAGIDSALDAAEGSPPFLEEAASMLGESAHDAAEHAKVPATLEAVIGARFDALPARAAKRLAQHASVVGNVFWTGAIAYLGGARDNIDETLRFLAARGMLVLNEGTTIADEREWAFRHSVVREVVYGRLSKRRRAEPRRGWLGRGAAPRCG